VESSLHLYDSRGDLLNKDFIDGHILYLWGDMTSCCLIPRAETYLMADDIDLSSAWMAFWHLTKKHCMTWCPSLFARNAISHAILI
jgi:hypothetical protein